MKAIILSLLLLIGAPEQKITPITASLVVKRLSSCDYFLLYNKNGYVVAEHYYGKEFDEGETVYGNINQYGYVDVYDEDLDESEHIYIEDYRMGKSEAVEKLLDECN
jgi:hypothetical protein